MRQIMNLMRGIPVLREIAGFIYAKALALRFRGSQHYWKQRYAKGGTAGSGSCGRLQAFKAEVLNRFVKEHRITSVMEFGCGDGNQLRLANYEKYIGFDISQEALSICENIFHTDMSKDFRLIDQYSGEVAELALSLDVIYHLTEDSIFDQYMVRLFSAATRFVIIYSSNRNEQDKVQAPHVKHRKFTDWIAKNIHRWRLIQHIPNVHPQLNAAGEGSFAEFFIYKKDSLDLTLDSFYLNSTHIKSA